MTRALIQRLLAHVAADERILASLQDDAEHERAEQHIADVRDAVRLLLSTPLIPWRRFIVAVFCPRSSTTREWLGEQW